MTSTTTDLVNIADNTKTIPTLTNKTGGYTDTDFSVNSWGYKQDSNNYNDFKLSQTILENNDRTNADTTTLTFATKIDYLKESGTYKNTITFAATAHPICDTTITGDMQTFNPCPDMADGMTGNLIDVRDNQEYTIAKINGDFWMTQNLRYVGDTVGSTSTTSTWYLKSATSNVSADTTMSMSDLTSGSSYDVARFHNSGNTTAGVWYNYAAASAMTITGPSNTDIQTDDVCPKGWHLPSNSETSDIISQASAYTPVVGGHYNSTGSLIDTGYGLWWSSTSGSATNRYYLRWNASILNTGHYVRYEGFYIRCIKI